MTHALLLASLLLAGPQKKAQAPPPSPNAEKALGYFHAEEALDKSHACDKADSTVAMEQCLQGLLAKAETNYVGFVRALGLILRETDEGKRSTAPVQRIPLDEAETAWKNYRDKECGAVFSSYEGSTLKPVMELGCDLQLTIGHVRELHSLYSDNFQ